MPGMALVKTPADWQTYQLSMAQQHNVHPNMVEWGSGPRQFPCLVATRMLSDERRFLSCYVYPHEALSLVEAAQASQVLAGTGMAAQSVEVQGGPTQEDFNKHTAAMLMAVVEELESMSVTSRERFEAALTRCLARVDQYHADDKTKLKADLSEGTVLKQLFPKERPDGNTG